jgi:hypothetical protein
MYQAICPDCGATITLNVPGDIWAGCPSCQFYGQVPALEPMPAPTPLEQAQREVTWLRERLEAARRANERLEAENDWLRGYKAAPASEAITDATK